MTKSIRVENADTSDHIVSVQCQDRHSDGTWLDDGPPFTLANPAQMATLTIWDTRRYIVSEQPR